MTVTATNFGNMAKCNIKLASSIRRLLFLSVVGVGAALARAETTCLTEGTNPAISPDGTWLAFQRDATNETWLGIRDLASGSVRWVEKGPGRAAFPAWTKTGALLYSQGNVLHSAYENWHGEAREGYGIRIFENGASCDLLPRGRWLDYSPAPTTDGRTLWFVSSRSEPKAANQIHSSVFKVDLAAPDKAVEAYTPRVGHPCGVSQAAVSPDGRHVVWGEQQDVHAVWCLNVARTDDFTRVAALTPPDMAAYSPNWSPDGQLIAFTGYREGDEGWCIYLLDPARGAAKRLCRGENPSFVPDGKSLVFDLGGKIYRRELTTADRPGESDRWPVRDYRVNWTKEPEKVLWRGTDLRKLTAYPPFPDSKFGLTRTFFARAKVVIPESSEGKSMSILGLYYKDAGIWLGDHGMAFVFAVDKNRRLTLAAGNAIRWGQFCWSRTHLVPGKIHTVTGIRTDGALWVSVDDEPPERLVLAAGQSPLDEMIGVKVGHPYGFNGLAVHEAEVGAGWPVNVPQPKPFGGYGWEDVK